MKQTDAFEQKNILVLGLAKSGASAALLLKKLRANVVVNDAKKEQPQGLIDDLKNAGINLILGNHPDNILTDNKIEMIVKNPGIPYTNPVLVKAKELKIPIISEPELAYQVMEGDLIAVTGSNGKTTVTTLVQLMLNEKSHPSFVAGNIGVPATSVIQNTTAQDRIVMEVSSFMLAGIDKFHPHIAVINNIFSNHLDWHGSRENYIKDKLNITKNQTQDDYLIMNWDREEWQELSNKTKAEVVPFSRLGKSKLGSYVKDNKLYFKDEFIMDSSEIGIPGEQNVENALAAIAVAKLMGVSNKQIIQVLTTFSGVKHRIQFVENYQGRQFYNDSKATDIEATQVALKSFDKPIILIAGGLDRGDDYTRLVPYLQPNVKEIIVNGETSKKMILAAEKAGIKVIKESPKVKNSVVTAFNDSEPGDVILLSPAAASWDQYKTFEERGDEYITAVQDLYEGKMN